MLFKMLSFLFTLLMISAQRGKSLFYDYNDKDYIEVYPDSRDPEVLQGRTPLHFALIMSLGGQYSQTDGSGALAGVKVALDRINNDSKLLPGYSLHYTITNSQLSVTAVLSSVPLYIHIYPRLKKNPETVVFLKTVSLNALHYQVLHAPTKLAVIGSGCSVATEPTAEISHYYNVTQISCFSTSNELSNRIRFPRYFQLGTTGKTMAFGFYGTIKEYGWKKIALIVQDENLFTETMADLKDLLDRDKVDYTERVFKTSKGIASLGPNPFDEDSRIFLLSMYAVFLRPFLCEAYHRGILFPKYLLLAAGWQSKFWWRVEQPNLTCTADQRERALFSTLAVSQLHFLDKDQQINTTPGITTSEFFAEEEKFFGVPPLNFTSHQFSHYCHDATWTLAYALNKTINSLNDTAQEFNITPQFKLEDFSYSNSKLLEIIFGHLENTSFNGLTGPVSFDSNGITNFRKATVYQYRDKEDENERIYLDRYHIGDVDSKSIQFIYARGENFNTVWNSSFPYDGVPRTATVSVHPAITSVYIILACAGIIIAIGFLVFNFTFRKTKLIKLASTKLNYLIGIGAIILYLDTFFFVIPSTDQDVVAVLCNLTPWLTAIGYSLCYGTILAKMARVYYIFNNLSNKKKKIKDRTLILGVASLVAIDLIILVTYTVTEGIRGNLLAQEIPYNENPSVTEGELEIIIENFTYICDSRARDIFLGILYGYKMLLQILALFLAFAIRKVKIKGLDDAKYIAAAIYVTSIVLAMIIVATYTLKYFINGFTALFCTGFLVGTTVILILVFVPLIVGLYLDPKGEDIFKRTAVVSNSLGMAKESENRSSETDQHLRKRIKALEDEVKEKDEIIAIFSEKDNKNKQNSSWDTHEESSLGKKKT